MNEFKGAPGPWDLGTPEIQGSGLHMPIHSESHGELAMVVWQMEDDRHDGRASADCEANARLIAAAPELLAALQAMELEYGGLGEYDLDFSEPVKLAMAAIAKALGK